jgi:hypothetical protein
MGIGLSNAWEKLGICFREEINIGRYLNVVE